jgi:5'-methylthioadenosine phosphorylase
MIGIIGGTGFYNTEFLKEPEKIRIETQYGEAEVYLGRIEGITIAFLPRHGADHRVPPHRVDYRKNILALKIAGAGRVISINSVGSLDESFFPGSIIVPHDFIDFTKGRSSTLYDDEVVHVDMTEPYCGEMRKTMISCANRFYKSVFESGVYACTEGPRFETPAEITMLRMLGGDVVGMVGCPEIALAREAGLCYVSICTIANYGSGITNSPLSIEEVKSVVSENLDAMRKTVACAIGEIPKDRECRCPDSTSEARV